MRLTKIAATPGWKAKAQHDVAWDDVPQWFAEQYSPPPAKGATPQVGGGWSALDYDISKPLAGQSNVDRTALVLDYDRDCPMTAEIKARLLERWPNAWASYSRSGGLRVICDEERRSKQDSRALIAEFGADTNAREGIWWFGGTGDTVPLLDMNPMPAAAQVATRPTIAPPPATLVYPGGASFLDPTPQGAVDPAVLAQMSIGGLEIPPPTIGELRSLVMSIPAADADPRESWVKLGMALHKVTNGSAQGLDLWKDFGKQSAKYHEGVHNQQWASFKTGKAMSVGLATIIAMASMNVAPAQPAAAPPAAKAAKPAAPPKPSANAPLKQQMQQVAKNALGGNGTVSEDVAAENALVAKYVFVRELDRYFVRGELKPVSREALRDLETSNMPQVKKNPLDPVKVLRESKKAIRCGSLTYAPGSNETVVEDGELCLNTWRDPHIAPVTPDADQTALIEALYLRVVDDPAVAEYLRMCMAWLCHNPTGRLPFASLLTGTPGCGKSTLFEIIPQLVFGTSNVSTPTPQEVESTFTDWLQRARIVSLAELHLANRRDAEGQSNRMKSHITSPRLRIIPKGLPGFSQPNRMTLFATSNYRAAVSLQIGDRRWFVHHCDVPKFTDAERSRYYGSFLNHKSAPGILLGYFLSLNVSKFDPVEPVRTTAHKRLINASFPTPIQTLLDAFSNGELSPKLFTLEQARTVLSASGIKDCSTALVGQWLRHDGLQIREIGGRPRLVSGGLRTRTYTLSPHWNPSLPEIRAEYATQVAAVFATAAAGGRKV